MIILGLDLASKTGWALYDTGDRLASIRCGTWQIEGGTPEQKAACLARRLSDALRGWTADGCGPRFAAYEEPLRILPQFGGAKINPAGIANLTGMSCAAAAVFTLFNIRSEAVPVATWRKGFLGYGRKAGMVRADYKRAAIARCKMLNIAAKTDDAAEAVGIAFWGSGQASRH